MKYKEDLRIGIRWAVLIFGIGMIIYFGIKIWKFL